MGIRHIHAFVRGAKLKEKGIHIKNSNPLIGPIFKRSSLHDLFLSSVLCAHRIELFHDIV